MVVHASYTGIQLSIESAQIIFTLSLACASRSFVPSVSTVRARLWSNVSWLSCLRSSAGSPAAGAWPGNVARSYQTVRSAWHDLREIKIRTASSRSLRCSAPVRRSCPCCTSSGSCLTLPKTSSFRPAIFSLVDCACVHRQPTKARWSKEMDAPCPCRIRAHSQPFQREAAAGTRCRRRAAQSLNRRRTSSDPVTRCRGCRRKGSRGSWSWTTFIKWFRR
jgi:hypothetical protein